MFVAIDIMSGRDELSLDELHEVKLLMCFNYDCPPTS